jgi:uncharacterized protein with HEPN domain
MAKIDDAERIAHMLDYAKTAVRISKDKCREDLDSNEVYALAIVRALEVVGEASNRVSSESRTRAPGIPWANIVSLRHRIVHGYDMLNRDLIWRIVTSDLAPLIAELEKLVPPNAHP